MIFAFTVAGFRFMRFLQNGSFIKGWLLAILLSLLFSVLTNIKVLFPHRHLEYLMAPISIISVYGIKGLASNSDLKLVHVFSALGKRLSLVKVPFFSFSSRDNLHSG